MKKEDRYSWLRDPNWPTSIAEPIIKHLEAENAVADEFFGKHSAEVESLFAELKGRIKEDDTTVPIARDGYLYYSYIRQGQDYWVHARKFGNMEAAEEVLLDENVEAKGHEFYKVGAVEVSPDHKLIAYTVDFNGSEKYTIFIREIENGKVIDRSITDVFEDVVWDANSKGVFYVPTGAEWRAEEVHYYNWSSKESKLLYKELDKTFWVGISKTSSERYLVISTRSGNSNEERYLDLTRNDDMLTVLFPRKEEQRYYFTHHGDHFYIAINDMGKNYRLVRADVANPQVGWIEVRPHRQEAYITRVIAYKAHLVIETRVLGLGEVEVVDLRTQTSMFLKYNAESYDVDVIFTTFDADSVRYRYSSLAEPTSIIEYGFDTGVYVVRKVQEIPSGYDATKYETKRIWAMHEDGTKIPISILYRKDLLKSDGSNPAYLYGYGSYGIAIPPQFRISALSLVDRGFVFAIGHIRGGDDLGYEWYESAKFLTKKRTFEDFIACAHALIEQGYTKRGEISICGGSAGGMLVGYCVNNVPELYKAAIFHVPFVDVLATMLDETLPLTPGEFKEWGNPKEPAFYEYIKSYSPMDNVKAQRYPHIFITSGINDPRVGYWEPTKFAQKVRDLRTNNNMLILKTNMSGGHRGKSGRYDFLKEIAEEYVFVIQSRVTHCNRQDSL